MNLFQRVKKLKSLWELTGKEPEAAKELEAELLPGKAVFLADMDAEERDDYIKRVEDGWGEVIARFREAFKK
jgi:hypothetical protein